MGRLFNILVYISLIFLIIALYTADYLVIPKIYSHSFLLLSVVFLFAGHLMYVVCWDKMIRLSGINVSFISHLAGNGLSIFGKYIPGKVWVLLGRSVYLNQHHHTGLGKASALSVKTQLISIWAGLFLGILGYMIATSLGTESLISFILWLAVTPLLFNKTLARWTDRLIGVFINKNFVFSPLVVGEVMKVLPWNLANWLLWAAGFYYLILGLTDTYVPVTSGLSFVLAANLGIIAIFAPGGLGVREAVIIAYLNYLGFSFSEATTIAIASRLWFLFGEIFLFTCGMISHRLMVKRKETSPPV